MTTLLIADHDNATLKEPTARALTAAAELGGEVHVLVAGKDCAGAAEAASKLAGVAKVLKADDASLAHELAEPLAALVVTLAPAYDALVAPATTTGKNVMPRVAALLDVMQVSEITKVVSPDTFERPIYAGNAIETVQSTDAKKVITDRASAFKAAGRCGSPLYSAGSASWADSPACFASSVSIRAGSPSSSFNSFALRRGGFEADAADGSRGRAGAAGADTRAACFALSFNQSV